jgi:uncharacterized protein
MFAPLVKCTSVRASATFAKNQVWGARGFPMLIAIKELELHPIDFDEEYAPGAIELGPDLSQRGPLNASGRAQLVEEHHGKHLKIEDIRLAGELSTQLEMPCARCLEPVVEPVKRSFDLLYRPQGVDAGREEVSVTAAEAEVSYYQGEGLLLEDALREQVLLAAPLKVICREDCKGLCPQCGHDRNSEQCQCESGFKDPRWAALDEIRKKLQH